MAADHPHHAAGRLRRLAAVAHTLGSWPILPSAFGAGGDGHVYVGGYMTETLYRLQ